MTEISSSKNVSVLRSPWKRVWWLALIALLGSLWYLTPSGTIDEPVVLHRGEDGQMNRESDGNSNSATVRASAATLQSRNNAFSSTGTTSANPAWVAARTLVIFNRSEHLLMSRIGEALLDHFEQSGNFDSVTYLPAGHSLKAGVLSPDLYLTLNLKNLDTSGVVGRDLKASLDASLGTSLVRSNHSVSDSLSPPTVQFRSRIEIEHESSLLGVESAGARFRLQGQDIAKQLIEQLDGCLEKLKEDRRTMPELPGGFTPMYEETPELASIESFDLRQRLSVHGLMLKNETVWEASLSADPQSDIDRLSTALKETGWSDYDRSQEPESPYLRMKQGARWLEVFRERSELTTHSDDVPDQSAWYIRYRSRMDSSELHNAMSELLNAEQQDLDLLLVLRRYADGEQQQQILTAIEANPPRQVETWLALAEWYQRKKQPEKLLPALQQAYLYSLMTKNPGNVEQQIKTIAKKEEIEFPTVKQISPELIAASGIPRIDVDDFQVDLTFDVDDVAAVAIAGETEGQWRLIGAVVSEVASGRFELTNLKCDLPSGSRGWSTRSPLDFSHPQSWPEKLGAQSVHLSVSRTDDGRFHFTGQLNN